MMKECVLLTGGSRGIGKAIRKKYEDEGYSVIAPTRGELDLESGTSIAEFLKGLRSQEVGIFVHCAGYNNPLELENLTDAELHKTFQINCFSFFSICKHLAPAFVKRGGGSIVGISSIYGHYSRRGRLAYAASKHALNGMIKTLALELGPHHVKVNAISPGFIDTEMTRQNNSPEIIAQLVSKVPVGHLGDPADIAEYVFFLSSPKNRFINGECIIADGGLSAGNG